MLLLWPVVLNRDAFVFSDTINYLAAGRKVWATVAHIVNRIPIGPALPSTAVAGSGQLLKPAVAIGGRSPYYGMMAWGAFTRAGSVGVAVVQAVWVGAALLLALGRLGFPTLRRRVVVIAVLSAASTIGFFTSTVMPDVFCGLAVVAIALLWFAGRAMEPAERAFWLMTLLAATLFHVSILLMAAAITIGLAMVARRRVLRRDALLIGLALGGAVIGTAAIDTVAAAVGRTRVVATPLLLARLIGDGTAGRVLAADCPVHHYVTCRYLPALPLRENDFLWHTDSHMTAWINLPEASRSAVAGEQRTIVRAVLTRYPLMQLEQSLVNAVEQLWTTGLGEFEINPVIDLTMQAPEFAAPLARYHASAVYRDRLSLTPLATIWALIYAAAAAVSLAVLLARRQLGIAAVNVAVVITLLAGIVINAVVNGTLSGVFGRYGARAEWLALFGLIILVASRRERSRA